MLLQRDVAPVRYTDTRMGVVSAPGFGVLPRGTSVSPHNAGNPK